MAAIHSLVFLSLFHPLFLYASTDYDLYVKNCTPFSCSKLGELKFPCTNTTLPENCGPFVVDGCDKEAQKIQFERGGKWFEVESISQANTITVTDKELESRLNSRSCESFNNLSLRPLPYALFYIISNLTFFKCDPSVNFPHHLDFSYTGCKNFSIYYAKNTTLPSLPPTCSIIHLPVNISEGYGDIFRLLTAKFSLEVVTWLDCYLCLMNGGKCQSRSNGFRCVSSNEGKNGSGLKLGLAASAVGSAVLMITLCYFWRKSSCTNLILFCKRKTRNNQSIEIFLRNYGPLVPKRFSYSEVKQMTDSFKDKLGQGGYGSVFKGKLPDGSLVALKVLKESQNKGEEFLNEVASIGRTSHVNIVTLLGFCAEGSKRALIYEFMPNGSLDKHIYEDQPLKADRRLGWETLYQISVGIARGLEYLHRGCNARILHFDIKPHNILLDENFCPRISDFGLAKICPPKDSSTISLLGARGTTGYIAPEVFCRNFGGVSHKSDVYSYGMLLLEIVGGRKNVCVEVDNISEMYFPHWICKRLESGEELGLCGIKNEEENRMARKMTLVSLWCIQTDPSNRPSISRVVEMLQGDLKFLPVPPRPILSSPSRSEQRSFVDSSSTSLRCFRVTKSNSLGSFKTFCSEINI